MADDRSAGLPCLNSSASFWLSEPSTFLLGHRTTAELPDKADVVIVGSGITGASAARYFAEDPRAAGLDVVLLEAREACWGATGRNGGHCQPLLFERSTGIGHFEIKNVAEVKSYIDENNVPCEFRSVTACHAFWGKENLQDAQQSLKSLQETDTKLGGLVELITSAKDLKNHRVDASASGAFLTVGAASLWPYKLVTFMLEKAIKSGRLNLQTHTPVTSIYTGEPDEQYPHGLSTPRGTVRAKHVVLATNGYTSHLMPFFSTLIVPLRCEMSALKPPADMELLPNSYGFLGGKNEQAGTDDYLIQRPFYKDITGTTRGGHLMYGGGRAFAEQGFIGEYEDDIMDQGEAQYLRKALLRLMDLGGNAKDLKELTASHQWTGIKGYSRDNAPWVGKIDPEDRDNVWISAGYTGHGMPNATLCAKAVVEMILSKDSYETTCERLVENGDLPREYVSTLERQRAALKLQTVAEQDATALGGGISHKQHKTDGSGSASDKSRSCSAM